MFGFLVAPVGVEPRPALVGADHRQRLGDVVGQVQFDGAERLDNVGHGRGDRAIDLVPGNVVFKGPTPFALGPSEEITVEAVDAGAYGGVVGPKKIAHRTQLSAE